MAITDTITTSFFSRFLTPRSPKARKSVAPHLSHDDALLICKDTGLSLEDATGQPSYDETLPFFMQHRW